MEKRDEIILSARIKSENNKKVLVYATKMTEDMSRRMK